MSLSAFSSLGRNILNSSSGSSGGSAGKNVISSTSLVYYYDFETASVSGSTLKNQATNTTDLTITGSPMQTTTFHNGAGASKSSATPSYCILTNWTNLSSANQTLAFWMYPLNMNSSTGGNGLQFGSVVYNYHNALNSYSSFFQMYFDGTNHNLRFFSFNGSGNNYEGSVVVSINAWHHVCVIKSGSTLQWYVDNSLKSTSSSSYSLFTTNDKFCIGYDPNQSTYYFNGVIDDFRIYNRSITGGELTTLYGSVQ